MIAVHVAPSVLASPAPVSDAATKLPSSKSTPTRLPTDVAVTFVQFRPATAGTVTVRFTVCVVAPVRAAETIAVAFASSEPVAGGV